MSMMKADEMQCVKCTSMKLTDDVVMFVSYQYHTEKNDLGKVARDKSTYRWLAQIMKLEDAKALAAKMRSDAERLKPWRWENDPSWSGKMYTKDSTNLAGSDWILTKLKKLTDWELGQKHLKGWQDCKQDYKPSATYDTEDYICPDGSKVSLTDKEALLKHVGEILWKPIFHKGRKSKAKKVEQVQAAA